MGMRKWVVTIKDDDGSSSDYEVEAYTEDGAINRASDRSEERHGRKPHESQIVSFREGQKC
jgi:hypothetical protein